jgi:hypothetical protein
VGPEEVFPNHCREKLGVRHHGSGGERQEAGGRAVFPCGYSDRAAQEGEWDYNPYDPAMEAMGEKLRMDRMLNKLKYRKQIGSLYANQKGLCLLCKQPITRETGWHDHHDLPHSGR